MIFKRELVSSVIAFSCALLLSACNTAGTAPQSMTIAAAQPVAPKPVIGSFLSGVAGQSLDETDRQLAYNAQIQTAGSGKRSQWRAQKSDAYGYVEISAANSPASSQCKTYQHVIYTKGRSQRGSGETCQSAAGNWEIVN